MASISKGRTAATLAVLAGVLVVMVAYGLSAASKPFPALGGEKVTCQKVQLKKRIYRKEITVSVFNATKRKGLADRTMAGLEKRSFRAGAVGNAAKTDQVQYVEVRTTVKDDPAAALVAAQFKPAADVVVTEDDLGPGIDLVLGTKFTRLHVPSPKFLKLKTPRSTCLDKVDPNAGLGGT